MCLCCLFCGFCFYLALFCFFFVDFNVWLCVDAGGTWQPSRFYDLCDQFGIMVFHDQVGLVFQALFSNNRACADADLVPERALPCDPRLPRAHRRRDRIPNAPPRQTPFHRAGLFALCLFLFSCICVPLYVFLSLCADLFVCSGMATTKISAVAITKRIKLKITRTVYHCTSTR